MSAMNGMNQADAEANASVRAADGRFFEALVRADGEALGRLLHERFILVDVMSGSVIPKADVVPLVASRRLVFEAIGPDGEEPDLRFFGPTAVVTGRTRMTGSFDGTAFTARSRYAHVFVADSGGWTLVNAQGTPLT
ncbi:nuclear transport factor 2 family protein [Streptomyces sp. ISL-86]|uniref:nuclear transport factor 2 family protein n=1 Tax=Streptomyces sp. ISL-86 TaxID=2819187 RepID=UPI001BE685B8|nr:nuclear transport factor 2 family protein [Streptomyces sp. ISL-86]MBT2456228.1 nuclear transport factor 2 family protein [Streptomyces sp. ISL-86]